MDDEMMLPQDGGGGQEGVVVVHLPSLGKTRPTKSAWRIMSAL